MDDLDFGHVETLRATPLARWLWSAFERRLEGTVVLQEPTGEKHALRVDQGAPTKVYLATQLDPFDERTATDAADDFERRVAWLSDRPLGTRFFCFEGIDYLAALAPRDRARELALALLWRVIRDQKRVDDARDTLAELGERQFFLDHTAPLEAFHFSVEDSAAVRALQNGSHQLESVLAAGVLPREQMERLLYVFTLTGWLVSIAPEALFPATLSSRPPEPIESETTRLKPESYVRALHPGRTLADEASASGRSADDTQPVTSAFSPDALSRAEALLTQGNLAGAEREVALGLETEPQRVDLLALHTWLQAQRPGENLAPLWTRLDLLVRKAPNNLRVHFYRGLLLKKMGKHASALQEFREVVDRDPHHIDAAREVYLYEKNRDQWLRSASSSGSGTFAKSSDGLLSRILGRRG